MTHFLALGHSHLSALRHAQVAREKAGVASSTTIRILMLRRPEYEPTLDQQGRLHAALLAELRDPAVDGVVLSLFGNAYQVLGLINHPQKFDFVHPKRPDLPLNPDAEALPYGAVREHLVEQTKGSVDLLRAICAATALPVFMLETPPPVPSEEHIRQYPGWFEKQIAALGLSPPTLRYKIWLLQSEIFAQAAREYGATFVNVPSSMRDADGMLSQEAWNTDPTHGNGVYGERQYQQLEALAAASLSRRGACP